MRKYGWKPQIPDFRDKSFLDLNPMEVAAIPPKFDQRSYSPPCYDQESLGSCTANAIAGLCEIAQMREKKASFTPSRLFIYYNERFIEGTTSYDSGAFIRDGIKSLKMYGFPAEVQWPYVISKFTHKPDDTVYHAAIPHRVKVKNYGSVAQDALQMKTVVSNGYPIAIGFTVYESFESSEVAKTGVVSMPQPAERVLGGHAVSIVGYDDDAGHWIVRNSWGTSWGDKGHFYMPYEYFLSPKLSSDLWCVRFVQ